ncbi:hypothetical protein L210DRAFT_2337362 [Boletus edulis BED1]|uniref:Secreted protein n=1 Tax=Boletus edulis BED1 TaxID=1328754 RepID=A0AAD4BQJ1_BOLED|nr:hypothetical protein L210DRAFT_2337362 [Boletus edulis BED1]
MSLGFALLMWSTADCTSASQFWTLLMMGAACDQCMDCSRYCAGVYTSLRLLHADLPSETTGIMTISAVGLSTRQFQMSSIS